MKRVLILCPEAIRPVMAGMGIRCWEIARALSTDVDVTLGIPNDPEEAPAAKTFRTTRAEPNNIAQLVRDADSVITLGHASDLYFDCGSEKPLIVDLYDPFPIENLNYSETLGREPYYRDRATIERQLLRGDLFLCSTSEQRLFYLGMLFTLGRLNPESYREDFTLRNLIRVVPFGVPTPEPVAGPPLLRGVLPGIGAEDPIVLFGGVYEWHDPFTLLRALPVLLGRFPDLRVVFSANPHPDSTPQESLQEVVELSRSEDWIDRHVFVVPWVPYDQRAGLYLEATVGVALHHRRFETEVSMRTRVFDYLWAGLPVIATEGGGANRLLSDNRMGRTVPAAGHMALAAELTELLDSPATRERMTGRGRRWAANHTWDRVLEPLREFAAAPRIDPNKDTYPARSSPMVRRHSRAIRPLLGRLARRLRKGL